MKLKWEIKFFSHEAESTVNHGTITYVYIIDEVDDEFVLYRYAKNGYAKYGVYLIGSFRTLKRAKRIARG
jgi:hypothetical protein